MNGQLLLCLLSLSRYSVKYFALLPPLCTHTRSMTLFTLFPGTGIDFKAPLLYSHPLVARFRIRLLGFWAPHSQIDPNTRRSAAAETAGASNRNFFRGEKRKKKLKPPRTESTARTELKRPLKVYTALFLRERGELEIAKTAVAGTCR